MSRTNIFDVSFLNSNLERIESHLIQCRYGQILCDDYHRALDVAAKLEARPYIIGNGSLTQAQYDDINAEWLACNEVEPVGIGNSRYWMLPFTHPFFLPAMLHDMDYPNKDGTLFHKKTRLQCDRLFLKRCLAIAKEHDSIELKMLAWALYGIVRQFGGLCWGEKTHRLPEKLVAVVDSQRVQLAGLCNMEMLNLGGVVSV